MSDTTGGAITLQVGGNNASTTYAGVISGPGSLTKNGGGTFTLAAANVYSGNTTVAAGRSLLANSSAVPAASTWTMRLSNGLAFGSGIGTFSLGGLAGSGNIALADLSGTAVSLQVGGNGASTSYSGVLSGPGSLAEIGPGTLILTGCNTYSGGTTISAGTLQVSGSGTLGTGTVTDNGALLFNLSGNQTFGGVISGSGSMTQSGTGLLTLTGSNTYTGGTTISGGSLQIDAGGAAGSITGSVVDNGLLAFNRSDTLTFGGEVSGSGSLTQLGPGTLILMGSNSYSGSTTISGGTLQIDNGGNTGSLGSGNVMNNAVLVFSRSDTYALPGTSLVPAA